MISFYELRRNIKVYTEPYINYTGVKLWNILLYQYLQYRLYLFQNVYAYSPFGAKSPSNPYSEYGSKYGSKSVNNPYSEYGSKYGKYSPNNPYSEYGGKYGKYSPDNPYSEGVGPAYDR